MTLSRTQKRIIIGAITLGVLIVLFPPFYGTKTATGDNYHGFCGYGFIGTGPFNDTFVVRGKLVQADYTRIESSRLMLIALTMTLIMCQADVWVLIPILGVIPPAHTI